MLTLPALPCLALPRPCRPLQFAKLRQQGCSFLVAGRQDASGAFKTLADLEMPPILPQGVRWCLLAAAAAAWLDGVAGPPPACAYTRTRAACRLRARAQLCTHMPLHRRPSFACPSAGPV